MSHMDRNLAALKENRQRPSPRPPLRRRLRRLRGGRAPERAAARRALRQAGARAPRRRPPGGGRRLADAGGRPGRELPHLVGGGGAPRPLPGRDLAGRAPPPDRRPRRHLDHQHLRAAPAPRRRPARPGAHHPPARLRPVFQRHPRPRLGAPRHESRRAHPRPGAPRPRGAALHATPPRPTPRPRWRAGPGSGRRCAGRAAPDHPADGLRRTRAATRSAITPSASTAPGAASSAASTATSPTGPAAEDVGFIDLALARRTAWAPATGSTTAAGTWPRCPTPRRACRCMARHTAAVLAARLGLSRRAIVLDLDNTLWGGVVGDDGIDGIVLGGGTAGEAFQDFQVALKEMVDRGILLAVCSKNDPRGGAGALPQASRDGAEGGGHRRLRRQLGAEVEEHPGDRRHPRPRARQLHLPRRQPLRAGGGAPGAAASRRADPARRPYRLPRGPWRTIPTSSPPPSPPPTATAPGNTGPAPRRLALAGGRRIARGLPGEPGHEGADRRDRRGQHHPRGAAHQQDQPVQPHHPPAQQGRARGLPRPPRCARPAGAPHRPLRRPRAHRRGAGRGAGDRWRAAPSRSTPCS